MNKCNALVQGNGFYVKVPHTSWPVIRATERMRPGSSAVSFALPLPSYHYAMGYNPVTMITYWCSKKNSIHHWIDHGIDFVPSNVPCTRSGCEHWREGECIHLTIRGK